MKCLLLLNLQIHALTKQDFFNILDFFDNVINHSKSKTFFEILMLLFAGKIAKYNKKVISLLNDGINVTNKFLIHTNLIHRFIKYSTKLFRENAFFRLKKKKNLR